MTIKARIYFYFFILITLCKYELPACQVVSDEYEIRSVYFGGGSYYIDTKQKVELIEWLDSFPFLNEYEIIIHGHTDDIGQKEYNQWLSARRSEAVKGYLLSQEIPKHWMQIKDFGEENPLYNNNTWNGKLNNRRVDVILVPPST